MVNLKKDLALVEEYSRKFPKSRKPVFGQRLETGDIDFEYGPVMVIDETDYSEVADNIINGSRSCNTQRAYIGDIHYFIRWSAIATQLENHFPVNEETILSFIIQHLVPDAMPKDVEDHLIKNGVKLFKGTHSFSTVKRRLDSISVMHRSNNIASPCNTQKVKDLLAAMRKEYGKPTQKKAITRDVLDDLLDTCKDSLIDIRDRAILLFGWASGGRRRSEIVEAAIENLTETPEGDYTYRLGKTKTDKEGKGCDVPVKGRAAKALLDWIRASKVDEGHIFRSISKRGEIRGKLSGIDINRIVKKRAKMAGYNEEKFGAHSLRSGFVTEGGRKGKPIGDIMAMTTHKNVATAMTYYQSGAILNNSAANIAD